MPVHCGETGSIEEEERLRKLLPRRLATGPRESLEETSSRSDEAVEE